MFCDPKIKDERGLLLVNTDVVCVDKSVYELISCAQEDKYSELRVVDLRRIYWIRPQNFVRTQYRFIRYAIKIKPYMWELMEMFQ